jgi:hypothetical protein
MNQESKLRRVSPRRFAVVAATLGLLIGAPALSLAQTNNASPTGVSNANANALANSNVKGVGQAAVGTAPVPETSTWVAMATLVAGAAFFARKRRRAAA